MRILFVILFLISSLFLNAQEVFDLNTEEGMQKYRVSTQLAIQLYEEFRNLSPENRHLFQLLEYDTISYSAAELIDRFSNKQNQIALNNLIEFIKTHYKTVKHRARTTVIYTNDRVGADPEWKRLKEIFNNLITIYFESELKKLAESFSLEDYFSHLVFVRQTLFSESPEVAKQRAAIAVESIFKAQELIKKLGARNDEFIVLYGGTMQGRHVFDENKKMESDIDIEAIDSLFIRINNRDKNKHQLIANMGFSISGSRHSHSNWESDMAKNNNYAIKSPIYFYIYKNKIVASVGQFTTEVRLLEYSMVPTQTKFIIAIAKQKVLSQSLFRSAYECAVGFSKLFSR